MPNGMSFTASTPGFNNYYTEQAQPSQNEVMMASQSDQSFEQEPNDGAKNKSKVSVDVNQPFKDRFYHHDNERHFQQTVNNDDIFLCYDFYDEMSKGGGQRSMVSNESVVPGRRQPNRKISKQGFAPGFEPKGPGNRSFANPGTSGVLSNRSGISEKFLKDPPQFQKVKPGFLDNIGGANPPHRNQLHSPTSFVVDEHLPASPRVTHDPVALRPAGPRFKGARQSQKMSQRQISSIQVDKKEPGMRSQLIHAKPHEKGQMMHSQSMGPAQWQKAAEQSHGQLPQTSQISRQNDGFMQGTRENPDSHFLAPNTHRAHEATGRSMADPNQLLNSRPDDNVKNLKIYYNVSYNYNNPESNRNYPPDGMSPNRGYPARGQSPDGEAVFDSGANAGAKHVSYIEQRGNAPLSAIEEQDFETTTKNVRGARNMNSSGSFERQ